MKRTFARLALVTALVSVEAAATTMPAFSTQDMVREAAVIVRGSVVGQRSLWNHDKTLIVTESTISVSETLVGRTLSKTIVVRQLGGEVDGLSLLVPGTAQLKKGRTALLFLRKDANYHYLVGMAQGHYTIHKTKQGEEVSRNVGDLHLIAKKLTRRIGHRAAPIHSSASTALSYKSFKLKIKQHAKALGRK